MSQLKVFKVRNLGAGKVGVECPSCGGKHVVRLSRWRTALPGGTRPCPYCFKASWISKARKLDFEESS